MEFHKMSVENVEEYFDTDIRYGLTSEDAFNRYKIRKDRPSVMKFIFKYVVKSLSRISILRNISFLAIIIIIFDKGNKVHSFSAIVSAIITIVIRAIRQWRESRGVFLRSHSKSRYLVIRQGIEKKIKGSKLVQGDIIHLEKGAYVPADIRVVFADKLKVNESIITGSEKSISKSHERVIEEVNSPSELSNILFMGSYVEGGEAFGIIIADYTSSIISGLLEISHKVNMPSSKVKKPIFTGVLLLLVTISVGVFYFDIINNNKIFIERFLYNGMVIIVTIPYALGEEIFTYSVKKEYENYNIRFKNIKTLLKLREVDAFFLEAQEGLGVNEKNIESIYYDSKGIDSKAIDKDSYTLRRAMEGLLLTYKNHYSPKEDKSDEGLNNRAITSFALKNNTFLEKLEKGYTHCFYLPDNIDSLLMGRIVKQNNKYRAYVKGEVLELLKSCTSIMIEGIEKQISDEDIKAIKDWNYNEISRGNNTVAVAYRIFNYKPNIRDKVYSNLVFVGMISLRSTIDSYNYETMNYLVRNNLRLSLFTENNPIAFIKFCDPHKDATIVNDFLAGVQLHYTEDIKLPEVLANYKVFHKVDRETKERLLNANQGEGYKTAVTGVSYNDYKYITKAYLSIVVGEKPIKEIANNSDMWIKDDYLRRILYLRAEGIKDLYSFRRYQEIVLLAFAAVFVYVGLFDYIYLYLINFIVIPLVAFSLSIRERESIYGKDYYVVSEKYNSKFFLRIAILVLLLTVSYGASGFFLGKESPKGNLFLLLSSILISSLNYSHRMNKKSVAVKGTFILGVVFLSLLITHYLKLYGISNILLNCILVLLFFIIDLFLFKRT